MTQIVIYCHKWEENWRTTLPTNLGSELTGTRGVNRCLELQILQQGHIHKSFGYKVLAFLNGLFKETIKLFFLRLAELLKYAKMENIHFQQRPWILKKKINVMTREKLCNLSQLRIWVAYMNTWIITTFIQNQIRWIIRPCELPLNFPTAMNSSILSLTSARP